MTLRTQNSLRSAHINLHHKASILEVGCRQLRRIDWAGRPICLFLFAFRNCVPPADDETVLGGATQSAAPLCECCAANYLRYFPTCGAAAPSDWTSDPPRGEPRFAVAPRLRLPTSTTRLGSFSSAFAYSFDVGSHRHNPTCWGRCVLWATR